MTEPTRRTTARGTRAAKATTPAKAPAKTPADIVQKLNAAVNKALAGEMRDRLIADGIVPGGGSVAEFTKFQADDIAASGKIIADKKITLE